MSVQDIMFGCLCCKFFPAFFALLLTEVRSTACKTKAGVYHQAAYRLTRVTKMNACKTMKTLFTKLSLALCCWLCALSLHAQQKNNTPPDKKLDALSAEWNMLIDSSKYQQAMTIARKGFAACQPHNYLMQSRFLYYIGYCHEYMNNNYDSAVFYYEKAYPLALKAKSLKDEADLLMRLNYMYYYVKKYTTRDTLIRYIKTIVDTTKDLRVLAVLNGSIGEYYLDNSAYESFIKYKLKAIDYRKQLLASDSIQNKENIGISYLQIVQAYIRMHQDEKALEYLGYSREYIKNFRDGEAFMNNDYIHVYLNLDKFDEAVKYDKLLYSAMHPNDSLFINLSFARRLFADYYCRKGMIAKSETEAREALRLAKKSTDEEILCEAHLSLGKIEYKKGAYREAINYLNLALPSAYNYDREMYLEIQKKLAESFAALHQFDSAYLHYQVYSQLQDTLYTEASKRSLAEAEAKYQNKNKQAQINAQTIKLEYARKQQIWLWAAIALISLVAMLLVIIYRNKKRTADVLNQNNIKLAQLNNDLEEANETKAKLFGIISHDLRSPISQVYQFLKLQQMAPDMLDDAQRNSLSSKIQSATGSLLETMEELLLWSKTQMNQFKTDMQPVYINDVVAECMKLLQLNIEAKNIAVNIDVPDTAKVTSDPYFLQTILRNLLQNAIKSAPQNGTLNVSFVDQKLSIENSGGHFSQQQYEAVLVSKEDKNSLSGLGLRLVDELSKKIDARVEFTATTNDTTIAEIQF
jgi:signal transduction histidine kinase